MSASVPLDRERSESLASVVDSIWATMLGMPIEPAPPGQPAPDGRSPRVRIELRGPWNGSLELTCSDSLARFIGSALFQQDPWELDEESGLEAALELANMIGGNVRPALGPGVELGLPVAETGPRATDAAGELVARAQFDCLGEPLRVELWRERG